MLGVVVLGVVVLGVVVLWDGCAVGGCARGGCAVGWVCCGVGAVGWVCCGVCMYVGMLMYIHTYIPLPPSTPALVHRYSLKNQKNALISAQMSTSKNSALIRMEVRTLVCIAQYAHVCVHVCCGMGMSFCCIEEDKFNQSSTVTPL